MNINQASQAIGLQVFDCRDCNPNRDKEEAALDFMLGSNPEWFASCLAYTGELENIDHAYRKLLELLESARNEFPEEVPAYAAICNYGVHVYRFKA